MIVNHRLLNPNAYHLLRYIGNDDIRQIILYGGSSSGKSYSAAQVVLLRTLSDGGNTLVLRKVAASVEKSIYEDFKVAARQLGITHYFRFRDGIKRIKCLMNSAKIDFGGLDDPEKIKGISNYVRLLLEEMSEFDLADYKQLTLRLRGQRGQKIIGTFNPISEKHWLKTEVFDSDEWTETDMTIPGIEPRYTIVKSVRLNQPKPILNPRTKEIEVHAPDTVVIQSTYLNNFWVVGSPDGTYGYYDEQAIAAFDKMKRTDPDYYNIYALGEWGVLRTGCEFFPAFRPAKHTAPVDYDSALPIHLSVDNNRLPYITCTLWQVDYSDGVTLRQFHEILAVPPDNSARKAALLIAAYLRSIGYADTVYLHGDCTTRNGSTIDDEGRSFLDKVISTLTEEGFRVEDKVGRNNPSVAMTGEFINTIWDDDSERPPMAILIGETCSVSIDDYQSVQKDANGAILKTKIRDKSTGQSYEAHGHISDTMRYIVHDILRQQYTEFANKRKRNLFAREGQLSYFNPQTECVYTQQLVYCMPNVGGKCVIVHGRLCGERWHIVDVTLTETASTSEIKDRLNAIGCNPTYLETGRSYYPFVRELRSEAAYTIKVMPEEGDIDRRIAATSDYVRDYVLFDSVKAEDNDEYAAFVSSLLDYRKDAPDKEASAALSGFAKIALKNF